ncbi:MAG: hypothetical protein PHX51_08020 [Clostridia bacterium]|nr:hypothetical protein [Clostridia bacterium]
MAKPDSENNGDYQLKIAFDDGSALIFTVAMYGGLFLHNGTFNYDYYIKNLNAVQPLSEGYRDYYYKSFSEASNMSVKAFLATEQRFPGIGNGVLQDILFEAGIHPKNKIGELDDDRRSALFDSITKVLSEMTANGGRNTEKDLFGEYGRYQTKMSKLTVGTECRVCGEKIVKQNYLGGSVYFCPHCQTLK